VCSGCTRGDAGRKPGTRAWTRRRRDATSVAQDAKPTVLSLSELPTDELIRYGRELGLELSDRTPQGEVLRRVRQRQALLVELDRDALLDVVVWMRRPVRRSASKEVLAKEIARSDRTGFEGLSDPGLWVLARLRGVEPLEGEPREQLEHRVAASDGLWSRIRRRRRQWVGRMVVRMMSNGPEKPNDYQFLPEEGPPSLREEIEDQGVVGGIARRLRGVADDYVREKLDEIERRIDRKLDEIDHRLAEWRDREIANRLRILKITLVFTVLVALISLVYSYVRHG
jgi:hypothetical protein